ncbi:MAG: hypothetical protein VKO39_06095 [Cyanobacteriota bacterium]|nr:hypothetical protein [Cyanobacteriota bacterium]
MEAIVAAGFSAIALSASMMIIDNQNKIASRARDLSLIEAAVNDDISAIRHQARNWLWSNSYYKPTASANLDTNLAIYTPSGECYSFTSKGLMELSARSDMGLYTTQIPGTYAINRNNAVISKTVPGFEIRRQYSNPTVTSQVNNSNSTAPTDQGTFTLRVSYTVNSVKTDKNGMKSFKPFPFNRTVDVLLLAQLSC